MLWTDKYRPNSLTLVIGNDFLKSVLSNFLANNELPNLLLHGPSGVGKTTIVRAVVQSVALSNSSRRNGQSDKAIRNVGNILTINASDDRSIQIVREKITPFVASTGIQPILNEAFMSQQDIVTKNKSLKIVILEEIDSFTVDAQFCLRRLMEIHARNARFCMTCNNVSKLIPALRSRCCEYKLSKLDENQIFTHLKSIIDAEHVQIQPSAIDVMSQFANGDLRRGVSAMQIVIATAESTETCEVSPHDICVEHDLVVSVEHVMKTLGFVADITLRSLAEKISVANSQMDAYLLLTQFVDSHMLVIKHLLDRFWFLFSTESALRDISNLCLTLADIGESCSTASKQSTLFALSSALFLYTSA